MPQHGVLSLKDFAAKYGIRETYGACLAYFSTEDDAAKLLGNYDSLTGFYDIVLIREGSLQLLVGDKPVTLSANELLVLAPYQPLQILSPLTETLADGILMEPTFFESMRSLDRETDIPMPGTPVTGFMRYYLNEEQKQSFLHLLKQMRLAIKHPHIYKVEIIKSLLHVCLLFIHELPFDKKQFTHDFKHKENIFKIFMHLAHSNFRKERQLRFYADKLNITPAYLSRTIKDISGSTVGEHLARLTCTEACRLLEDSDKTVGEIADALHFSDQSAFTNFFKAAMGVTPLCYRQKKD